MATIHPPSPTAGPKTYQALVSTEEAQCSTPVGRQKEPPVCRDEALRSEAWSTSDLKPLCFPKPVDTRITTDVTVVSSSSSSECTRESDVEVSDHEGKVSTPVRVDRVDRTVSQALNAKVSQRKTSRQGRSTQRWVVEDNETIRLVTGCVPILQGSKILVATASRKAEWILPKGVASIGGPGSRACHHGRR